MPFVTRQPGTATECKQKRREELRALVGPEEFAAKQAAVYEAVVDFAGMWNEHLNMCYASETTEVLTSFLETGMFTSDVWTLPGCIYTIGSVPLKAAVEKDPSLDLQACSLDALPGPKLPSYEMMRTGLIPALWKGISASPWSYADHVIRGIKVVSDDEVYLMMTIRKFKKDDGKEYERNDSLSHLLRSGTAFKVTNLFMFDNLSQDLPASFKELTDGLTLDGGANLSPLDVALGTSIDHGTGNVQKNAS